MNKDAETVEHTRVLPGLVRIVKSLNVEIRRLGAPREVTVLIDHEIEQVQEALDLMYSYEPESFEGSKGFA